MIAREIAEKCEGAVLALSSSVRLTIGSVIGRSYRLLHPIGEGGLSRVWVAEQFSLERRVAIKVLTEGVIRTAAGLELFQREARATARVDHPHVVRIVDFDVTEEGVPFLVFELLVGETLEQRLARGPIDLDEARVIMAQTCDALAFAHERGVLHRDIKAENLFLQQARAGGLDVKLLDFGIALRKAMPLAHDTGVAGTPPYMSPEQLEGREVDERCDLFSLAVCVYYALTKEYPYPGATPAEAALSLAKGTFGRASALRPELPVTLDEWFSRALATDRDARFESARAMLAAFERACQPSRDTPVAVDVSAAPPRERSIPWAKASALVAAAAVIALLRAAPARKHAPHAAHVTTPPPTATKVVSVPVTVLPTPQTSDSIDVVPVEALPRAQPRKVVFRATPKPKPAASRDAGVEAGAAPPPAESASVSASDDPIPEFGGRE